MIHHDAEVSLLRDLAFGTRDLNAHLQENGASATGSPNVRCFHRHIQIGGMVIALIQAAVTLELQC